MSGGSFSIGGTPLNPTFVATLYQGLLGRLAEAYGLGYWSALLDAGASRVSVAGSILGTAEAQGRQIEGLYQTLLGRNADSYGLAYWTALLQAGQDMDQVKAGILASQEFFARAGGTVDGFLHSLYRLELGRDLDPLGAAVFGGELSVGVSREAVAEQVVDSPEAHRLEVQDFYKAFLGRPADSEGLDYWAGAMDFGMTEEQVSAGLLGSNEYIGDLGNYLSQIITTDPNTAAGGFIATYRLFGFQSSSPQTGGTGDTGGSGGGSGPSLGNETGPVANPLMAPLHPSASGQFPPNATTGFVGSQALLNLVQGFDQAQTAGTTAQFLASQQKEFVFDPSQRVLVNVRGTLPGNLTQLQNDLENQLGMTVTLATLGQQLVTGYLPIDNILQLPTLQSFAAVTPVYAPHFSVGAVTTQGDALIGANTFRAQTGLTGTGVTVGVLSDSVNQRNSNVTGAPTFGIAQSQATGDLPASGVQVLQDGTSNSSDEGRGMLEIIHDVAPGANLAFNTAEGGPQAFAQGIVNLATQAGAQVIADDAQYPDEPFFNDGVLAQTIDQVAINHNVLYLTAAGNNANHAWESDFNPTQTVVAGNPGTFATVGSATSTQVLQHFSLAPGQTLDLSFQWDAAFLEGGSSLPQYQVPNEMDVLVTDSSGQTLVQRFGDDTRNTGEALQRVVFTNTGNYGTNDFALSFQLMNGPAPTHMKWIRFDNNGPIEGQGGSTIFGHAASRNAVTVGAVPYNSPQTPESFTSQGVAPIYFDAKGERLSSPALRYKPDLAGPDGVNTANFPIQPAPLPAGTFPVFFGTSAAVAHLAGSAALLRNQSPTVNYWSLLLDMEHKAIPVGAPGWNALTGFGIDPMGAGNPVIPLSATSWTLVGPAPLAKAQVPGALTSSGRVVGLAPDPANANTIYMAAAGGGVWKTTDGGTTWTPLTDTQTTLFMGAIAVAPNNDKVIYAGTGESTNGILSFYGRGILVSQDAGASWKLQNNNGVFNLKTISRIAVDPTNAQIVYVAMADEGVGSDATPINTGIWKSTDGGATWKNTTTTIPNITGGESFTDVVIDPTNPSRLFCAIGEEGGASTTANGVYVTTDGGNTWRAAGNFPGGAANGVTEIALAKSNPQVLYAGITDAATNGLLAVEKTTDGGTTWTKLTQAPDYLNGSGFYASAIVVSPTDPNTVFVAGAPGNNMDANGNFTHHIFETTDGGTTWTDISVGVSGVDGPHVDHHALLFDANGTLLDGNDGGVWKLTNPLPSNIVWSDINGNLATIQFIGIALHPTDPNTLYGGAQDNGTNKFTGQLAWNQVRFGDGGFPQVDFTNPNTVYHTFFHVPGLAGFIERSDDAGATWNSITTGINVNDNSEFYVPYVMDPANSSRLVLGTDHVYETTTKGNAWKAIGTPGTAGFAPAQGGDVLSVALAKTDANTVYVTTTGADIFVTTNDGATWTKRNIPNIMDQIRDLEVDPTNSQIVYAVRDQFGQGKVFRSTDGGQNWKDISGNLPDLPAYSLQIDATNNILYLGTDNGVFFSKNLGQSWAVFGTGLPNVQVRNMVLNPTLGVLAVATHGRSVWEINTGTSVTPPPPPPTPPGGFPPDQFDPNQTSDTAHDFGLLAPNAAVRFPNLNISNTPQGLPNYDWFRWEPTQAGTFTAFLNVTSTPGDLEMHLFTINNGVLTELANSSAPNTPNRSLHVSVKAFVPIFVEIKGRESSLGHQDQAMYTLSVELT